MARKTVLICDNCDGRIDGTAAEITVVFAGVTRKGDWCGGCAPTIPTSRVLGRPRVRTLDGDLLARTATPAGVR